MTDAQTKELQEIKLFVRIIGLVICAVVVAFGLWLLSGR